MHDFGKRVQKHFLMSTKLHSATSGWQLSQDPTLTALFVTFSILIDLTFTCYEFYKIPLKKQQNIDKHTPHNTKDAEITLKIKSNNTQLTPNLKNSEHESLIAKPDTNNTQTSNDPEYKFARCPNTCVIQKSPFFAFNLFAIFCGILGLSFVITFGLNVFLEYSLACLTIFIENPSNAENILFFILFIIVWFIVIKFIVFIYKESILGIILLWYNDGDINTIINCNCNCFIDVCCKCSCCDCECGENCCNLFNKIFDVLCNCDCLCFHCGDKCCSNMNFNVSAALIWRVMQFILHTIISSVNAAQDNADVRMFM